MVFQVPKLPFFFFFGAERPLIRNMNVFLFTVFLIIVACILVGGYQIFGRTYCLYLLRKEISTLQCVLLKKQYSSTNTEDCNTA